MAVTRQVRRLAHTAPKPQQHGLIRGKVQSVLTRIDLRGDWIKPMRLVRTALSSATRTKASEAEAKPAIHFTEQKASEAVAKPANHFRSVLQTVNTHQWKLKISNLFFRLLKKSFYIHTYFIHCYIDVESPLSLCVRTCDDAKYVRIPKARRATENRAHNTSRGP